MDLAGKAMGRQPFDHGIGVQKGAVDAIRGGAQDAVQADGISGHDGSPCWV